MYFNPYPPHLNKDIKPYTRVCNFAQWGTKILKILPPTVEPLSEL